MKTYTVLALQINLILLVSLKFLKTQGFVGIYSYKHAFEFMIVYKISQRADSQVPTKLVLVINRTFN